MAQPERNWTVGRPPGWLVTRSRSNHICPFVTGNRAVASTLVGPSLIPKKKERKGCSQDFFGFFSPDMEGSPSPSKQSGSKQASETLLWDVVGGVPQHSSPSTPAAVPDTHSLAHHWTVGGGPLGVLMLSRASGRLCHFRCLIG